MNERNVIYLNDDRQFAAMQLREHITQLLSEKVKDYSAIKIIYSLILEEEAQDLSRRKVEIAERESEHKIKLAERAADAELDESKKPKILTIPEIKHRVRVLLGKECPQ